MPEQKMVPLGQYCICSDCLMSPLVRASHITFHMRIFSQRCWVWNGDLLHTKPVLYHWAMAFLLTHYWWIRSLLHLCPLVSTEHLLTPPGQQPHHLHLPHLQSPQGCTPLVHSWMCPSKAHWCVKETHGSCWAPYALMVVSLGWTGQ